MYTNKQIWSVSYPILLSLLAQNVINVTDTAFLGHVSEVALGASAMGGLFYICVFTIAFGFSTGSQIVIARRNGEGRYSDVGPVMIQGVMFLFVMALLLFGFTKAFGGNIMRLLVSSESIYEGTMEFLDWRIYGFFFSFINVMFRALYIGITRTKVLTINAIVMALTNVVLDYALIFGKFGLPEMGIKGAAIASVLAEASSILFFVIYTYATVDLKKYGMNRLRTFDPALLMRILSISCFTMLQYFLSMATWFVFFVAVERLGQRELAIANIVRSIYVVLLIPVNALATTTNSLVSNAIGAGGIQHVMPLINKIARFSFFICRSRYTNACSDDLFFVQTFFCDLGIHRLCDVCDDIFAVVFGSCLNFPFIQDFSVYIKKSAFYGCSADIDSKTIFFHFFCSSFFFASDF